MACIASHYAWGRPLEVLELLSKHPRDVAGDDGLDSHSALGISCETDYLDLVWFINIFQMNIENISGILNKIVFS